MKLKFRCWNGEEMVSPDYIDREGIAWWKENSIPTMSKNVMVWTGLLDKQGKEIYEGDILEFDAKEWGGNKGNRFPVVWDTEEGAWDTGGGTNRECAEWKTVIGNIYENPELLETK